MSRQKVILAMLLAAAAAAIALTGGGAQAASRSPVRPQAAAPGVAAATTPSAALPIGASVIYSNLGPGGTYYGGDGWCVEPNGGGCGPYQSVGMPFTPTANNQITQIDLGLTHYSGSNTAVIRLRSDAGGVPGSVIRSWGVGFQPPFGSCCGLTTIHVSPIIPVAAGTTYWLTAEYGPPNSTDVWNWVSGLTPETFAIDQGGGWFQVYDYESAFDVLGCGKLCKVS